MHSKLVCGLNFEEFKIKYENNVIPNICMKLTYTVVLIEKIFGYSEESSLTLILPIDSSILESEKNNLILNKKNLEYLKLPTGLVILFIFLFLIFLLSYYLRKELSRYIERKFFRKEINFFDTHNILMKSKLVEETFGTLPVKNFILQDEQLSLEVDRFTKQTIYYSYQKYRKFVFELIPQSKGLRDKIIQTIVQRDEYKASIVISIFIIFLIISLSIITNKIIPYFINEGDKALHYMAFFSFIYMGILIIECLILIWYIEKKKYLHAVNLTNNEKRILEEQFDNNDINSIKNYI